MQLQNSVAAFKEALLAEGHTQRSADVYADSLVTHANMCRTRADLPPGAFRDFVTKASRMTRKARNLDELAYHGADVQRAACEALHDLIMEGV
jgi:hypothetical protein